MKFFIIEGVVASGKSTVLRHLQEILARKKPNITKLYFTEHVTQRLLEEQVSKQAQRHAVQKQLLHIKNILQNLDYLYKHHSFSNRKTDIAYVFLERFLITHLCEDNISFEFAQNLSKELQKLPITHHILTLPKNSLQSRIEATLQHRNQHWQEHLQRITEKYGSTTSYFEKRQAKIIYWAQSLSSYFPTFFMSTGEEKYEEYARSILSAANLKLPTNNVLH